MKRCNQLSSTRLVTRLMCTLLLVANMSPVVIAQQLTQVSGKVVDAKSNEILAGVTVTAKRSGKSTATSDNGTYAIEVADNDTLVFSYSGYQSQEIGVQHQQVIHVFLQIEIRGLEEVVVTGYSSQRKQDITGSVSVVNMDGVDAIPTGSTLEALQGQASGVNIISSGVPGSAPNLFIRGVSSFGDASPLILVDGIQTDLNNINVNDIASIQVLKDAGAAAIYGVRGANGVIIVTTKRGKTGEPSVSYNAFAGVQLPIPGNPYDIVIDPEGFRTLALIADPNNALFRDGVPDFLYSGPSGSGIAWAGDPQVDPALYRLDKTNPGNSYLIQAVNKQGTNWFQELFNPAVTTNHNLSIGGGTDKSTYLVSLDYMNEQGTLKETHLKRYSGRVNTSFQLSKNIEIGENLTVYYRQSPGFANNNQFSGIAATYALMPLIPTHDIQGNYGGTRAGVNLGSSSNPVAAQERTAINKNNSWNAAGNVYMQINFLSDFKFRTSFGGALTNTYNYAFSDTPYENVQGFLNPNSFSENSSYSARLMWTNTVSYDKLFDRHRIQVVAGSESVENKGRGLSGSRRAYFSTDPDYLTLNTGTENIMNGSTAYENALFSLFARADYSFDDKYLIGGTIRRDGSSLFGPENRYGIFPSASFGWRLSKENFLTNVSWLNDLKLRGSYGILGSQNNISPENQFDLYGGTLANAYYDIRGTSNSLVQGFVQTQSGNIFTGWERNIVSNIGLDATILSNRFELSAEYYKKSIDGLLFAQTLPGIAGGASPATINVGDIQNTGVDLSATYRGGQPDNLQYSIGANVTAYKNIVKHVPDPGYFDAAAHQQLGVLVRNQVGQAVSSFYGYDVIGLFNSADEVEAAPAQDGAAPGRFRYRDVNGDNIISAEDRTFLGSPNPEFTYGINLAAQYKGFDLSTVLYGSQGNEAVNTVPVQTHFFGTYVGAKGNALFNAWTPENQNTTVPKIENQNNFSTAGVFNSYFIEDASYLRMRSLILGYTFASSSFLQRINLQKLRIYLQAANLFTITGYSGLDPELAGSSSSFGIDMGAYPNNQRSFLFGVNISF